MRWPYPAMVFALAIADPAYAEKLEFDHRTYPPLAALLDSGRSDMIRYDDSNPKYVTDRIAIKGDSIDNWSEALDIIVRLRGPKMRSIGDWAAEIRKQSEAVCASTFTTLAQDANSITFERKSKNCPPGVPTSGLYRIVAGSKSLFMLNVLVMGDVADPARRQWLELLGTAHVTK